MAGAEAQMTPSWASSVVQIQPQYPSQLLSSETARRMSAFRGAYSVTVGGEITVICVRRIVCA